MDSHFIETRVAAPAFVTAMLLAPVVPAGAAGAGPGPVTVERLKQSYLACEQEATVRRLTAPEAAACSQLAEQLRQRGFGGDLEQLLAWWRASRTRVAAPVH